MPPRPRAWIAIVAFNAVLALVVARAAPAQPHLTDRNDYDYNSTQPLTAYCPNTVYCYRILVPMLLELVPASSEVRWRTLQWMAHTASGTLVGIVLPVGASPFIAGTLLQTSYGFAYTAYDPFTPDPVVFLIAALVLYCWMEDRALTLPLLALVGVFAKETVALIMSAPAIAALLPQRRAARWRWIGPAVTAWVVLLGFHHYMDTYAGWGISNLPSAKFGAGSWLSIWWEHNPSLAYKALMFFAPFGFAWMFALLGYRHAPEPLRRLAVGALLPIAALVYVQTPERALGNLFFVVIPLAAVFLGRATRAAAWTATVANGLVTAKLGLSTIYLPSSSILLIPAAVSAAWAVASTRRQSS